MLTNSMPLRRLLAFACLWTASGVSPSAAWATPVKLTVTPGYRALLPSERKVIPIKVALSGLSSTTLGRRPDVNVAIVIDRSGSMAGDKIRQAKDAAVLAVSMLSSNDIVSVITYDTTAQVVVPATRLYSKDWVQGKIRQIQLGGDTALFAGVSLGASEVSKFRDPNRINRIILLSDGLANVGPSTPAQLGNLGSSLGRDGIAVSTIGLGLGFNEDLMTQLAQRSDGNHVFAEHAMDLNPIFAREFNDMLSVVAQNVTIKIDCPRGIRPVRILGRDGEVFDSSVVTRLNQIYGGQEKYIVFEAEVSSGAPEAGGPIASVSLSYWDPRANRLSNDFAQATVRRAETNEAMEASVDRETFTAYYAQLAAQASDEAIALADQGRKDDALRLLGRQSDEAEAFGSHYAIPELKKHAERNRAQSETLKNESYEKSRKELRSNAYMDRNQQMDYR